MAKIKFSKVSNNQITDNDDYVPSIKMGIDKAPSALIVQYITNMYTAPLEASIRETISNAFDSCSKNGRDMDECVRASVTDDVTDAPMLRGRMHGLPMQAHIRVSDRGCGMTYDQLVDIYTQYGISDKRGDGDESIGAFGLGSKSPLAYTTEFHILTKAKEGETYYLCAYKTRDGEFIANLPVKLQNGSATVTIYRKGEFIIPCKETTPGELEPVAEARKCCFKVSDPFKKGETGTVVMFPLNSDDDMERAKQIVGVVDELLRRTGTGKIRDDVPDDNDYAPYYLLPPMKIRDDDGSVVDCKVYLTGKVKRILKAAYERDDAEDIVAFKVGAWLYPAAGGAWRGNNRVPLKYARFAYMSIGFGIIIEVPSRALSFIPSRDSIINDDEHGNADAITDMVFEHIRKSFANVHIATDIYNWVRRREASVQSAIDDMFINRYSKMTYGSTVSSFSGRKIASSADHTMSVKQYSIKELSTCKKQKRKPSPYCEVMFDTDSMLASDKGGMTIGQMRETPCCLVGLIEVDDGTMKNKGVYAVGNTPLSQFLGDASVQSIGNVDVGYKFTKKKPAGDNLVADANVLADVVEISPAGAQTTVTTYGIRPSCKYPVGYALTGLQRELSGYNGILGAIVVDATECGIASARTAVTNIAINSGKFTRPIGKILYAIIPPKSARQSDQWTDEERQHIKDDTIKAFNAVGIVNVVSVGTDRFDDMSKRVAKTSNKSDLSKMFSNNRTCTLVNKQAFKVEQALGGCFYRKCDDILEKMQEAPSSWGLVVASDAYDMAHEQALAYSRVLFALDLVPEGVTNLACISSKNFNAERGNIMKDMGVTLVYDETGKADYESVVKPGSMFMKETSSKWSTDKAYRVNYDGVVPSSTKDVLRYRVLRRYDTAIRAAMQEAFQSIHECRLSLESAVSLVTFGRESYSEAPEEYHSEWVSSVFDGVTWGKSIEDDIAMAESVEKIIQCMKIWGYHLSSIGLQISGVNATDAHVDSYKLIGEVLGIDYSVESLYDGCPLEDIIA